MIKISVIIPSYNRANNLPNVLASVLAQSIQDIEVIIVDDGSTDTTRSILQDFHDPRVKYIYQENSGANTARNRGVDEAKGKYIAFLDSDDTFLDGHLERSLKFLEKNPNTAVFSRIIVDRGNGITFLKPPRGPQPDERIDEYLTCDRGFIQTSTLVIPTETARKVRYKEGLKAGQDIDFAIRLYLSGIKFHMINTPGAIWNDKADPKRISAGTHPNVRVNWLAGMKDKISRKSYLGFKGWFMAKTYAQQGQRFTAYKYYFTAALRGCYNPKLAATIFLQITLVGGSYRKLADIIIAWKKKGKSLS